MSDVDPTQQPVTEPPAVSQEASRAVSPPPPLSAIERRILGVLMEKARTTPDAYPLSLNSLVTGCNQKSNREPLMNLSIEQVEQVVREMRHKQLMAEVHSGGRIPRYRHLGYDYLGVKGAEAAVMTELLLRGEQTAGDLRIRKPLRTDRRPGQPAADPDGLMSRGLAIALTPAGRGQLITHNLYQPAELAALKASLTGVRGSCRMTRSNRRLESTPP